MQRDSEVIDDDKRLRSIVIDMENLDSGDISSEAEDENSNADMTITGECALKN